MCSDLRHVLMGLIAMSDMCVVEMSRKWCMPCKSWLISGLIIRFSVGQTHVVNIFDCIFAHVARNIVPFMIDLLFFLSFLPFSFDSSMSHSRNGFLISLSMAQIIGIRICFVLDKKRTKCECKTSCGRCFDRLRQTVVSKGVISISTEWRSLLSLSVAVGVHLLGRGHF